MNTTPLYPLVFHPRFKERVWGGRTLAVLYEKALPPDVPIGESWEITDRPGDESVIANGPLAGSSLRELMAARGADVLGSAAPAAGGRFPLLCKILDARERLSVQVHPPPQAGRGEPKTEMWYIADADPDAELFVGLKRGVTRSVFEAKIRTRHVAECLHRVAVRPGEAMFLPSGRVHAIGAGLVLFEIQQNSDTTYRVFDWNRLGLDGKPRELHVADSLESIDFLDYEPAVVAGEMSRTGPFEVRSLVEDPLFDVDLVHATARDLMSLPVPGPKVIAVAEGRVMATGGGVMQALEAGQFCLLPAGVHDAQLGAEAGAVFLIARPK